MLGKYRTLIECGSGLVGRILFAMGICCWRGHPASRYTARWRCAYPEILRCEQYKRFPMKRPIYLDNNSTTQLDPQVLDSMAHVLGHHYGNPSSSTHAFGWAASQLVEDARSHVASIIGARPEEITFTSGATESNNLAIKGLFLRSSKENPAKTFKVTSARTEHRAVLGVLESLVRVGCAASFLDCDSLGRINPKDLQQDLFMGTDLVTLMLANNETGLIHPIEEVASTIADTKALLHCDATQAVGKIPVEVGKLGVDLMSFSSHKLYGPKGVGALYTKNTYPRIELEPLIEGGSQEKGLRAGTLCVASIVGFGKACQIASACIEQESKRIAELKSKLIAGLKERISGFEVNSALDQDKVLPGTVNISFDGVDAISLIGQVSSRLALSTSSACTSSLGKGSHVLEAMGLSKERRRESLRISLGRFSTEGEVREAVEVLGGGVERLRRKSWG